MAYRVMRHPLGYNCNLYTGIKDQLKTLNFHEIWNDLQLRSMVQPKWNDLGSIKSNILTLNKRLSNNASPLDSYNTFLS